MDANGNDWNASDFGARTQRCSVILRCSNRVQRTLHELQSAIAESVHSPDRCRNTRALCHNSHCYTHTLVAPYHIQLTPGTQIALTKALARQHCTHHDVICM